MTITSAIRRAVGLSTEAKPVATIIEPVDPANRSVALLVTNELGQILLGKIGGADGHWGPTALAAMQLRDYWSFETAIRALNALGIDLARLQSGGSQIMNLGSGPSSTDWWIARRCITAGAMPAGAIASTYKWVEPSRLLTELGQFLTGFPAPAEDHYSNLVSGCRAR